MGDLADKLGQVLSQCRRVTPLPSDNNLSIRIDHEFGIWPITQRMLEVILHRVADPGELRVEYSLGFGDVHQPLFQIEGRDVSIGFRMGERLVDVKELHASGSIVALDRLQTENVIQVWRSGETIKHQHAVFAAQGRRGEFVAEFVVRLQSGELRPHGWKPIADLPGASAPLGERGPGNGEGLDEAGDQDHSKHCGFSQIVNVRPSLVVAEFGLIGVIFPSIGSVVGSSRKGFIIQSEGFEHPGYLDLNTILLFRFRSSVLGLPPPTFSIGLRWGIIRSFSARSSAGDGTHV